MAAISRPAWRLSNTGKTRTSSTSKTTKTTAKIKKRNETGARGSLILLNPHSRGVRASRLVSYCLDTAPPIAKKTPANMSATRIRLIHK